MAYSYAPGMLGVALLLGCSGERAQEPRSVFVEAAVQEAVRHPTFTSSASSDAHEMTVVCDKFSLITEATDTALVLSVDTDLPDDTVVMVGISRSYWETGSPAEYSVDYFAEKSTIGKWRLAHEIPITDDEWNSALADKQKEMSRLGLGFDVASISDKVTVSMVVPINQTDPRFGKDNANLIGEAVRKTGLRVVEDEVELIRPLAVLPARGSSFPSLDPYNLDVGQVYLVSR